ncbi:MAG: hypothetical protein AAGA77_14485 [Bacteroidota bacterium]
MTINKIIYPVLILTLLSSCKVKDLRTEFAKETTLELSEKRGRDLLERTYLKMGYNHMENVTTYEAKSYFDWKWPWSWMPMNALPGNKGNTIKFKFVTKTFDGSVEYLEGRKTGNIYGLQSWQSYEIKKDKPLKKVKGKRRKWGLATYHYITELPIRIRDAEIVKYAGEKEFEGQHYDLVFATWGEEKPHDEHDQYLIYINKESGMIDLVELTVNDFFLPMPNNMKDATVRIERSETFIGTYLPEMVYIQLGQPKKKSKHVYKYSMFDYQFDHFPEELLYPIEDLEKVGDSKEQ